MLKTLCYELLILFLLCPVISVISFEYSQCNCDDDGIWSIESILQCQKVSDFLIATAYFSIPLELLYFLSCSNIFPFKWVILQFGAFIVLCGLTHLLNVFTYEPHSFLVMLSLTVSKFLTALVSFATAITLLTLIPQLLRVKVRENLLRIKTHELDKEVGEMKEKEAATWHVRMLTQEIRKSLDRHTILYTTLVELSKTLGLENCAVWMPNEDKNEMHLTHELRQHNSSDSIPITDPDVRDITEHEGVRSLRPNSLLARRSSGGAFEPGVVAAIRMPMLKVSNFKGGTPEMVPACYAILVLVPPTPKFDYELWSNSELEIVEVVADQVAVALSHAAVLEESQLMRDKLVEQNRALQQARTNAMMASKARNSFLSVISQGMRRPMHSITGLLSILEQENLGPEQNLMINTMAKTSDVVVALINDIMENPAVGNESVTLEIRPFQLCFMIKAVASVARSLCVYRGFGCDIQIENGLPDNVVGDEKRILQVIMHMVDNLLNGADEGSLTFQISCETGTEVRSDKRWIPWKIDFSDGHVIVKFIIGIKRSINQPSSLSSSSKMGRRPNSEGVEMALSFNMCRKLVQMMQGNIWAIPNSQGLVESMILLLRFQLRPSGPVSECRESSNQYSLSANMHFRGLKVLLAEDDAVNRAVTQKLFEKLGCNVFCVSSGIECLSHIGGGSGRHFDIVVLGIQMSNDDGFEVTARIRKFRSGPWPLIVAMTANAQEDTWERCRQSGMVGVIQKPVTLQGIADELHRVLRKT